MPSLDPSIFKEYDIRGIVGESIDEEIVEIIGCAYGTMVKGNSGEVVSVGRDCRLSSPALSKALIKGINSTGIDVLDIGVVSTPMLYYSLFTEDVDGGVMVTASHNPGNYNGLKLNLNQESLFGEGIQKLRETAESGNFENGTGNIRQKNILNEYLSYLEKNVEISSHLKVAIDCGNGMVGLTGPRLLKQFDIDLIELYTEPDGTFPNHHPDPTVEDNLKDLQKVVLEKGCDVGFAFDGDGDRLGVIDENGKIIWGDMLVLIYAKEILKNNANQKVIGDVKCSKNLFDGIEKAGGEAIMWKTGHSLIKNKIREEKAALAGEMSGHIFFNDRFFGYDDALYAGLRLLEILSKSDKTLSQLLEEVPKTYSTPEIRVECEESIKFKLVEKVKNRLKDKYEVIDIDGVRVEFPDGWGLVRASNTQPALVLRFEAQTEERLKEIKELIESELEEATNKL